MINGRKECRRKFAAIKKDYPTATDKVSQVKQWHNLPKGCFFNIPHQNLHFNTHRKGGRHRNNQQVCEPKSEDNNAELQGNNCSRH